MGCGPFFCCFEDQEPKCLASAGIASSILATAFLIWGVADLEFKRTGVKVIYIIAFIFVIITIAAFITLFILLSMQKAGNYRTLMNIGRLICLAILGLCGIAFVFLLVSFIILLVDYGKLHSFLKDLRNGKMDIDDLDDDKYDWAEHLDDIDTEFKIVGHEWGAVIAPSIIALFCLVLIGLVSNVLYKVFLDNYNSTPQYPINTYSNQNTVISVPNTPQPQIFPDSNGQVPPAGNNINNPVEIKQN